MQFKRSKPRGSRYARKKIDPVQVFVAYEGYVDEKEYFENVAKAVPNRFASYFKFISVEKSTTAGAPTHVLNDLDNCLQKHQVKLRKDNNYAFMVIDKDHYFTEQHLASSTNVLRECRQKNIDVLCSTPSFELWLLLHFEDVSTKSLDFKNKALRNEKVNKGPTFLKREVNKHKDKDFQKNLSRNIRTALENEQRLNPAQREIKIPSEALYSAVGEIFRKIESHGIQIVDALSAYSDQQRN